MFDSSLNTSNPSNPTFQALTLTHLNHQPHPHTMAHHKSPRQKCLKPLVARASHPSDDSHSNPKPASPNPQPMTEENLHPSDDSHFCTDTESNMAVAFDVNNHSELECKQYRYWCHAKPDEKNPGLANASPCSYLLPQGTPLSWQGTRQTPLITTRHNSLQPLMRINLHIQFIGQFQ
mmetsp:Transcript_11428/g.24278  ORF Transcript_11428/g.24278 Transcript_11428/m.24278 type:complete len:177 (+) Transcript_11428:189-719(+)